MSIAEAAAIGMHQKQRMPQLNGPSLDAVQPEGLNIDTVSAVELEVPNPPALHCNW